MSDKPDDRETAANFPEYIGVQAGPEFGAFVESMRSLQDLAVSVALPADLLADVSARIDELVADMSPHQVSETDTPAGRALDLPGRGSLLMAAWSYDKYDKHGVRKRGQFRRFHMGSNLTAHGGVIPALFDDVFGGIVNAHGLPISRTAYLNTNYRARTPIDTPLVAEGRVDRIERRKIFVSAELRDEDGTLLADCEGLMVALPGSM